MKYETRVVSNKKEFVVQFTNVPYKFNDKKMNTFQYVLFEGSNDIQVNYLEITSDGEGKTVSGIENANGTIGLQYPRMDKAGNYRNFYVRYSPAQFNPPEVTTGEADSVTGVFATLNGTVNPNGANTVSYFQYGTSAEYGLATASSNRGSGTDDVPVSASIPDLIPGTAYHYRLVALNNGGTTYGEDRTFTTPVTFTSGPMYFPRIASNEEGWETEICVINTTDQPLNGVFRAYNNAGELIDEIDVALNPMGRREITAGDEFSDPSAIGYIVFEPDSGPVVGYMRPYVEGHYRAALPAASEINAGDIYISHIASDLNWWTEISLLNTTSTPRELAIEFDNGEAITVNLAAREQKVFKIRELFEGQPQPDIFSAVIREANGIVGMELFCNEAEKWMSGVLLNGETTSDIYYPHAVSTGGWETGIVAYNPSGMNISIVIYPYDATGNPYKSKTVMIGGKQKYIGLLSKLEIPESTAWLKIWSPGAPITGFELFARKNVMAGYTGVGISGKEGIFPKLENNGSTGIAFVNLGAGTASILLTAYDDEGNVIATETVRLASHTKRVDMAPNLFSRDISGATYITYSSDMDVAGFQLNASSDGMMLDALPGM